MDLIQNLKWRLFYIIFAISIFQLSYINGQIIAKLEGQNFSSEPAIQANDFTIDTKGNKIVAGSVDLSEITNSEHDFDPTAGTFNLPDVNNLGGNAGFIASYNKFGTLNYVISLRDNDIEPNVSAILVETDDNDNIYVLGSFTGKLDADPGEGVFELTAETIFTSSFFLASYDNQGKFNFAVRIPALSNLLVKSLLNNNVLNTILSVDDEGNSYLLALKESFVTDIDVDPGAEEYFLSNQNNVISYDSDGNFRFGFKLPTGQVRDISCTANGTVFITGILNESLDKNFDFDPGSNEFIIDNIENSSFYFASYSSNGELNFVKVIRGPNAIPTIIDSDMSGDIYIAGKMSGILDFDPGEEVFEVEVSEFEIDQSGDIFIAKYDENGELLRANAFNEDVGHVSHEVVTNMDIDGEGNLFITGNMTGGIIDFDPSENVLSLNAGVITGSNDGFDLYVASYNKDGDINFAYLVEDSRIRYSMLEADDNCPFYYLMGNLRENVSLDFYQNNVPFPVSSDQADKNLSTVYLLTILSSDAILDNDCDIFDDSPLVNQFPTVANVIADQNFQSEFKTHDIDISSVFSDPNDDKLLYSVISSNENVVTVTIDQEQTRLIIEEAGVGVSNITLTADDQRGGTASTSFQVTVSAAENSIPVVSTPIPSQTLVEGFDLLKIDLDTVFTDNDGDVLSYMTTITGMPNIVSLSLEGAILTIKEIDIGKTTIFIEVDDAKGGTASLSFELEVIPTTVTSISNKPLKEVINLFPNPVRKKLTINISLLPTHTSMNLIIIDSQGQKIWSQDVKGDDDAIEIDIVDLKSGYYIINFITDKNHFTRKLVVL